MCATGSFKFNKDQSTTIRVAKQTYDANTGELVNAADNDRTTCDGSTLKWSKGNTWAPWMPEGMSFYQGIDMGALIILME